MEKNEEQEKNKEEIQEQDLPKQEEEQIQEEDQSKKKENAFATITKELNNSKKDKKDLEEQYNELKIKFDEIKNSKNNSNNDILERISKIENSSRDNAFKKSVDKLIANGTKTDEIVKFLKENPELKNNPSKIISSYNSQEHIINRRIKEEATKIAENNNNYVKTFGNLNVKDKQSYTDGYYKQQLNKIKNNL